MMFEVKYVLKSFVVNDGFKVDQNAHDGYFGVNELKSGLEASYSIRVMFWTSMEVGMMVWSVIDQLMREYP
ncbi:hypothetical protein HanRHA438_Chr15g0685301 [Helianthus annuus]|jgi:hypothetical protein|uniref:Uncharacterized protein n=1 Tax=Helianthus annuus TaxID=4232 RepID=A0A9K3JKS5_HELAN|nr:hypothetical protein HanXRQr2_Chr02g0048851 [Helianthus annuus]KAJ0430712.1 hypothetical protein HanHA300_Chr17g0672121 [Helianthus annuus]KAJ0440236.1 hypothetical protein HanHA300_Chr16g0634191 [Helianthus annuus]KAJ0469983.1 hypothetical protein HanIR_Chr14g0713801 [Helianthus annuus]KAJ0506593.1 hypothetical protein HanHA89_Chr12g0483801 [Helianthus annuus]